MGQSTAVAPASRSRVSAQEAQKLPHVLADEAIRDLKKISMMPNGASGFEPEIKDGRTSYGKLHARLKGERRKAIEQFSKTYHCSIKAVDEMLGPIGRGASEDPRRVLEAHFERLRHNNLLS